MSHPLDQISSEEIEKAVDLYKSHEKFDEKTIFSNISLVEPEKQLLREHEATQKIPRILKIVGVDSMSDGGFAALVNLTEGKVDVERVSGKLKWHIQVQKFTWLWNSLKLIRSIRKP